MKWLICALLIISSEAIAATFVNNLNALGVRVNTSSASRKKIGDLNISTSKLLIDTAFKAKYAEAFPSHGGAGSIYTITRIPYSIPNDRLVLIVNNIARSIAPESKATPTSIKKILDCNSILMKNNEISHSISWDLEMGSIIKVNCGVDNKSYYLDIIFYSKFINESITSTTFKALKKYISDFIEQ